MFGYRSQAHAEDDTTTANSSASHSEGSETLASNFSAHAEGLQSKASGIASHVEGTNNGAASDNSHAGGIGCSTIGYASFTHCVTLFNQLDDVILFGVNGIAQPGVAGLTSSPNNGGVYSIQLAGGSTPPTSLSDGISAIIRTAIYGTHWRNNHQLFHFHQCRLR